MIYSHTVDRIVWLLLSLYFRFPVGGSSLLQTLETIVLIMHYKDTLWCWIGYLHMSCSLDESNFP